jgi:hypothetical protein
MQLNIVLIKIICYIKQKREGIMSVDLCFDALVNTGAPDCSFIESVADVFLKLPRGMWQSRNVVLIPKENTFELQINNRRSFTAIVRPVFYKPRGMFAGVGIVVTALFYSAIAITLTPLLGVGVAFKNISLSRSPKAKAYNQFAGASLKVYDLEKKQADLIRKAEAVPRKYLKEGVEGLIREAKELNLPIDEAKAFAKTAEQAYQRVCREQKV